MRSGGAKPAPRVVLDTNVVLSALVFSAGATAGLRSRWQLNEFLPLISTETVRELMRVLRYPKFRLDATSQEELLADYLPFAEIVPIPRPAPAVPACRDPDDLSFVHLATAGEAAALVTGDHDLLTLAGLVPFDIVTPDVFAASLAAGLGE